MTAPVTLRKRDRPFPPCKKCGGVRKRIESPPGRTRLVCWPCRNEESRRANRNARSQPGAPARAPAKVTIASNMSRRRWDRANPEKRSAHKLVEMALLSKRLVKQPCERCGCENVHAHHDDYSLPLDVTWLCPLHHAARHKELAALSAPMSPTSLGDSEDWRGALYAAAPLSLPIS